MFSRTFTRNGVDHKVTVKTEAELDDAVKAAKAVKTPTSPDINEPVKRGSDLALVDEALNVTLGDSPDELTGASLSDPVVNEAETVEEPVEESPADVVTTDAPSE